jgi:hypothetical protein
MRAGTGPCRPLRNPPEVLLSLMLSPTRSARRLKGIWRNSAAYRILRLAPSRYCVTSSFVSFVEQVPRRVRLHEEWAARAIGEIAIITVYLVWL